MRIYLRVAAGTLCTFTTVDQLQPEVTVSLGAAVVAYALLSSIYDAAGKW